MGWVVSQTNSDGSARLSGLMTLEINKVYSKISFSDAQWMLEKICQIKSEQVMQA